MLLQINCHLQCKCGAGHYGISSFEVSLPLIPGLKCMVYGFVLFFFNWLTNIWNITTSYQLYCKHKIGTLISYETVIQMTQNICVHLLKIIIALVISIRTVVTSMGEIHCKGTYDAFWGTVKIFNILTWALFS